MIETPQLYAAGIIGTGLCLPQRILTNTEIEQMVETTDEWITSRTGIKERRISGENEFTSDLAAGAGRMAIENAGLTPEEVDLIIVATITPDMLFPATACIVQEKIGAMKAAAFDISAGCSGFVYALSVASQFVNTGFYKNVLVIGAETMSKSINWQDRSTCVLFGDGSGAAIVGRVANGFGIMAMDIGADGSGADFLKQPLGGSSCPIDENNIKSNERYLNMKGSDVFKFAVRIMSETSDKVIRKAGLSKTEIDCLIPHQANVRIIELAAKRLDFPEEKVFINVDKYGNTSAASIPIALHEAYSQKRILKGDHVVLVGFGTGLTWGSCVIKWSI